MPLLGARGSDALRLAGYAVTGGPLAAIGRQGPRPTAAPMPGASFFAKTSRVRTGQDAARAKARRPGCTEVIDPDLARLLDGT
jgi:hypothetical protein